LARSILIELSSYTADFHQAFGKETIGPSTYGNFDQSYNYATADSTGAVYHASKAIADKHIWNLQKENPDVDITICTEFQALSTRISLIILLV